MNNYDETFVEELVVRRNSLKNLLIEALVVVAAIALAFALELRADDRTLTDADSDSVVKKILSDLEEKLNVTLR